MGTVSTITIGADTFSVYALTSDPVADADSYFAGRLGATSWTGAATLGKQQALITATRAADRGALWSGTQTDPTTPQPLQWPRDSATCNGDAVPDGTTPDQWVHGVFEYALALLEDESIQDNADSGSNVKRAKAGSAEVEFFRPTSGELSTTRFPTVVHELIGCYAASNTNAAGPFADGTDPSNVDEASHFCNPGNAYGLNEGYP